MAVLTTPGDFNKDNTVDSADYVVWRRTNGTPEGYDTWRANFGRTFINVSGADANVANATIPEPATLVLLMLAGAACCTRRSRAA